MPGVVVTGNVDFDVTLELWPQHILDYGDAVIASFCKKTKNSSIATFDRKFVKELTKLGIPVVQDIEV